MHAYYARVRENVTKLVEKDGKHTQAWFSFMARTFRLKAARNPIKPDKEKGSRPRAKGSATAPVDTIAQAAGKINILCNSK